MERRFKRRLREGDIIESRGVRFKIKEILSQDFYICDWDDSRSYVDIEFKDINGGYHHWKSTQDGGKVIYVYGDEKGIVSYLIPSSGWYEIPFEEINEKLTNELLTFMQRGYALSIGVEGNRCKYLLFNLRKNCKEFKQVEDRVIKNVLYDLLRGVGCHFCTEMLVNEYFSKELYQQAFDNVLLNGKDIYSNGRTWEIVLGLSEDGSMFKFLQAEFRG